MTTAVVEVLPAPSVSPSDHARLVELEEVIAHGIGTFVDVGLALAEIRNSQPPLYLEIAPTFAIYCERRWGYNDRYARRLMQAARVAEVTGPQGPVRIPSERVARELTPFLGDNNEGADVVADLWAKAVASVDRIPTPKDVRAMLASEGIVNDDRARATSGKSNKYILIGHVGDRLLKARDRLHRFVTREMGADPLTDAVKARALEYAGWCDDMAAALRAIAEKS